MEILVFLLLIFEVAALVPETRFADCIGDIPAKLVGIDMKPLLDQNQAIEAIKFYAWVRQSDDVQYYDLEYGNTDQIIQAFTGRINIYFHGIGENGKADWILQSKHITVHYTSDVFISVDYEQLVKTPSQGARNMDLIATRIADFLNWCISTTQNEVIQYIAFDIGTFIASKSAEKLKSSLYGRTNIDQMIALDPFVFSREDLLRACVQQPQINKTHIDHILVYHTSTCSHQPKIEACDSSKTITMGDIDFFPNGGSGQPGCKSNSTCDHIRAILYYIDGFSAGLQGQDSKLVAWPCPNFVDFISGKCASTCNRRCIQMAPFEAFWPTDVRMFLWTNEMSPYGRGYDQSQPSKI